MKDAAAKVSDANGLSDTQTAAIEALVEFKDSRAVPALQSVLEEIDDSDERETIISAIIDCGGYNANQQLNYLEAFAKKLLSENREGAIENKYSIYGLKFTLKEQIGSVINNKENPDENLVRLVIARVKKLKNTNLKLSNTLNTILQKWES